MNRIYVLELTVTFNGVNNTVHPVVLLDDKTSVLVDCGYPESADALVTAMQATGTSPEALTHIAVTHHDFDHMGCLAGLKKSAPQAVVVASAIDAPHIDGREASLRLKQAEQLHDSLPDSEKPGAEAFMNLLRSVTPVDVDMTVEDGQRLDWCGGTIAIATPGHMPGHVSFYVEESKTLIAGDALVVDGEKLLIANPHYTLDMDTAKASIEKLTAYDIDTVIAFHGGVFTGNVTEAFDDILSAKA